MLAKYGMTLLTLGWAHEYREAGVASNVLWPQTLIATAAVQNLLGGEAAIAQSRKPEIVADAAMLIVTSPARANTGNSYLDVDVLAAHGITDLSEYGGSGELAYDIFL